MREGSDGSGVSKYQRIKEALYGRFSEGLLKPGDRVPSENELAREFQVSIITARKALNDLVTENIIVRQRGRGSFVRNVPAPVDAAALAGTLGASPTASIVSTPFEPGSLPAGAKRNGGLRIVVFLMLTSGEPDNSLLKIIRGVSGHLSARGYSLVVEWCNDDPGTERRLLEKYLDEPVSGILVFSVDPEANADSFERILNRKIPLVMIDRSVDSLPMNLVASYNYDGAFNMTRYLVSLGHRRILFAGIHPHLQTERDRLLGFRKALESSGLPCGEAHVLFDPHGDPARIRERVHREGMSAVFCVHDELAARFIHHLSGQGVRIPADLSVSGFDDSDIGRLLHPALTTVRQPFQNMGTQAAHLLVQAMESGPGFCSQLYLTTKLVLRDSTGPAPSAAGPVPSAASVAAGEAAG